MGSEAIIQERIAAGTVQHPSTATVGSVVIVVNTRVPEDVLETLFNILARVPVVPLAANNVDNGGNGVGDVVAVIVNVTSLFVPAFC